jgi:pyruvate formate lyase activating enzyme
VDAFLYDIKAIDPAVHEKCTGKDNELIKKNLDYILSCGARVEVRIPLVPTYNDGEIDAIGCFLQGKGVEKVKVLAYHDLARSKYEGLGMTDTMPCVGSPTAGEVQKAVDVLITYGLNAVNGAVAD